PVWALLCVLAGSPPPADPQRVAPLLAVHWVFPLCLAPFHELGGVLLERRNVAQLLRLLHAQAVTLFERILAGGHELARLGGPPTCALQVGCGAIAGPETHRAARPRPLPGGPLGPPPCPAHADPP